MELKVEMMSKEMIKPLSPTPDHLRNYQLSFLDQVSPPVYNPQVLFYQSTKCNIQANNILKQSMSKTLTYYYPLAGRINDNLCVDCNDEGIPFLEAKVNCKLSDVLENPVPSELNKLLPFGLDDVQKLPLGIQFNVFDCGGIGIGVCISHKIADALSFFTFLNTWAAIARGESSIVTPEFVAAKLFPPKSMLGYDPEIGISTRGIVTKRFVFSASKIQEIKAKYTNLPAGTGDEKGPSRTEALSAFIWSRFVATTKPKSTSDSCFHAIIHAVNLRPRLDPPLTEHSFGNFYRIAMTIPSINPGEDCSYNLVNQMRDSIKRIDTKFGRQLQDGQSDHFDFIKDKAERFNRGEMISFSFTSLCRFPLYKADFGWGKPVWVGSASLTFNNLAVFMDTISGNGIDAWINLEEEDMAAFERDEALLAYAVTQPKATA